MNQKFRKGILKVFWVILFAITLLFRASKVTYAVCPVCTVAVGAGLGLSRWLGIDDAVSSIWIGGLILSSSFWLIDWMYKKYPTKLKSFKRSTVVYLTIILMYAFVFIPLKFSHVVGDPLNQIMGVDKILFGTALGSIAFLIGLWADKKERAIKGKQLFNYQKVIFPVSALVIASLLIYYYGGYLYQL